jgi:amidohydrolase
MDLDQLKDAVGQEIERMSDRLWELSLQIHDNPELGFEEFKASELLTNELEALGFDVQRGVAELPTAFKATVEGRPGGPTIGIQAEYDALPDIGHACGHNLIAGAAVGAGAALKTVLGELPPCRIMVIGTPAEEGGGGKIIMLDRGAFDDVDAALYVHAQTRNASMGGNMAHASMTVRFHGVPASIAGGKAPEGHEHLGASAVNALIAMFNNVNAIRQHIQRDVVVRGIINKGGTRRETVPLLTEAWFSARGPDHKYLKEVIERFGKCAEAAALATGTRAEVIPGNVYAERLLNVPFSKAVFDNMVRAGLQDVIQDGTAASSTDSGNVSHFIPLSAARIAIADPPLTLHSAPFADASRTDRARVAMLAGAKSMAWTALDLITQPDFLDEVRAEFRLRAGREPGRSQALAGATA